MTDLCIVKAESGNRKSDQRPFLKLTALMKDADGVWDVVTFWSRGELRGSVSATPGMYRGSFGQTVRMGRAESELVGLELVKAGWPE